MRIYIFVDERTGTIFHFPWFSKDPPTIVEAKVRRSDNDEENERPEDKEKLN
jgi:hypothetical protein